MFAEQADQKDTKDGSESGKSGESETPKIEQLDLSSESVVTSHLNVKGSKIFGASRPKTTPHKRSDNDNRDDLHSPDSIAATFTIREGKSERQTKVKMESLERRLKANEKARKEIEGEAEKWKDRAIRNGRRLPDLEVELAEMKQAKEEWMVKSQELEIYNKQVTEEKNEMEKKMEESEQQLKIFEKKMMSILNMENIEEREGKVDLEGLEKEIFKYQSKCQELEQENQELKAQIRSFSEKLTENQNHVSTLMGHLETNKEQSKEMHGICRKELDIRKEHENRINHDVTMLNTTINEQKMELEMVRSEIRCLRSYSQEMSTSNRNNIILLKSAETERRSLLETLVVLLNVDVEPTETNIKKTIRDLVREKNSEQTKRFEAEKNASEAEGILLEQAKQQRNALFRARVSEEEVSKSIDKIEELEQELLASDLERKNLEQRIETLEKCITKVSQMLNVNVGGVFDAIFDRIEDLINQESVYRVVVNENRLISENIFRGLQSVRKEYQSAGKAIDISKKSPIIGSAAKIIQDRSHTLKTIDKMDKLNKDILATMTMETLRAADFEKNNLKKKMNEQDAKIRQLEREKKEGERIRTIIAKWEKRNGSKVEKSNQMKKAPSMDHLVKSQSSSSILAQI